MKVQRNAFGFRPLQRPIDQNLSRVHVSSDPCKATPRCLSLPISGDLHQGAERIDRLRHSSTNECLTVIAAL